MSFLNSRPSHVQADNQSIPIPDMTSSTSPSALHAPGTAHSPQSFMFLCRLSLLCSRLQSEVCTLASSTLVRAERLAKVKSIEEDTQMLLAEVRRDETGRGSSSSGVGRSFPTCLDRLNESGNTKLPCSLAFSASAVCFDEFPSS